MKGLVATTAVLGVLAIGGLPALALTLAAEETGPPAEPATTLVEKTRTPGPPPWAQGRGGGPGERTGVEGDEGGPPGWAQRQDGAPPPGWARNHPGDTPHGWMVREWARCLRDGAGDPGPGDRVDPDVDCGGRPSPPARAGQGPGAKGHAPGRRDGAAPPGQLKKGEPKKAEKSPGGGSD